MNGQFCARDKRASATAHLQPNSPETRHAL
jgi:hypothetical protein